MKGEWQGKLVASLGVSGEVAPLEFSRLADGQHPQTEEEMVTHRRTAQEYTNCGRLHDKGRRAPGRVGCDLFRSKVCLFDCPCRR